MTNKIYPTGKFNDIDSEGYILNSGVYPVIQEVYRAPVQLAVDLALSRFSDIIHSIYLRGSVAKGIAVPNISDIDFIFISSRSVTREEKDILYKEFEPQVCTTFPFINDIEYHFQSIELLKNKGVQFMMKTQCVCIYGDDVNLTLPRFRIDKNAFAHIHSLEKDVIDTFDDKHSCAWIMKRLVRTGFELCMMRSQKYTRDLYPCYEVFSEYYPERKEEMFEALTLAIYPIDDKAKINSIVGSLGNFLIEQSNFSINFLT